MKLFSRIDPVTLMKKAIREMERIARKGAYLVLIETQGTCAPDPVYAKLPQLEILTTELMFTKEVIRTDYKFDSTEQALDLIEFFFGQKRRAWVEENNSPIVEEYTGIWWKQNDTLKQEYQDKDGF